MVTECVINAVVSPGPRTYQPQDPFSDSSREGEVSRGASGAPRPPAPPPYATASVQRGDLVSSGALRRMTHVRHEVMGDNKLVSNDGFVEADDGSHCCHLHWVSPEPAHACFRTLLITWPLCGIWKILTYSSWAKLNLKHKGPLSSAACGSKLYSLYCIFASANCRCCL